MYPFYPSATPNKTPQWGTRVPPNPNPQPQVSSEPQPLAQAQPVNQQQPTTQVYRQAPQAQASQRSQTQCYTTLPAQNTASRTAAPPVQYPLASHQLADSALQTKHSHSHHRTGRQRHRQGQHWPSLQACGDMGQTFMQMDRQGRGQRVPGAPTTPPLRRSHSVGYGQYGPVPGGSYDGAFSYYQPRRQSPNHARDGDVWMGQMQRRRKLLGFDDDDPLMVNSYDDPLMVNGPYHPAW